MRPEKWYVLWKQRPTYYCCRCLPIKSSQIKAFFCCPDCTWIKKWHCLRIWFTSTAMWPWAVSTPSSLNCDDSSWLRTWWIPWRWGVHMQFFFLLGLLRSFTKKTSATKESEFFVDLGYLFCFVFCVDEKGGLSFIYIYISLLGDLWEVSSALCLLEGASLASNVKQSEEQTDIRGLWPYRKMQLFTSVCSSHTCQHLQHGVKHWLQIGPLQACRQGSGSIPKHPLVGIEDPMARAPSVMLCSHWLVM